MDYKRHKKVIQEKTETVRKFFEKEYKDYKQLFENIKKHSKKKYFQEKLSFYKNDTKNTWKTLKDVIRKTKINENHSPRKYRNY